MAERPLLVFPRPTTADKAKLHAGPPKLKKPLHDCQSARLAPQFERLQRAMDQRRAALQDSTAGVQPEQVLVIDIATSIQDFHRAVSKIEGLEWLFDLELDEIEPVHGFEGAQDTKKKSTQLSLFEEDKKTEKKLRGQLFLVMTDQRALTELRSLFERWRTHPDFTFDKGLNKWRDVFRHLLEIRPWGVEDRLRDTGLLEDWKERAKEGEESVPFEIELWYHQNKSKRATAESQLKALISELDGEILSSFVHEGIHYQALLGRIPIAKAQEIINNQNVKLFQSDSVMYFRPTGQCVFRSSENKESREEDEFSEEAPSSDDEPFVALLDGLPLAGHSRLYNRLIIDDPDSYEDDYQASEREHGTAMASIILHGDLESGERELTRKLYSRPILRPRRFFGEFKGEQIPQEVLTVDLIYRAVLRIFEGEGDEEPAAPTIKIINLSVCDGSRPFDREMSAWARLIDWLSRKYNVLFIVSAGNSPREIELDTKKDNLARLTSSELQDLVVSALIEDVRNRRILSPAESLNALTVGASHGDWSTGALLQGWIDPFQNSALPSPASCNGPGYLRAIKPDILLPGGRQPYKEKLINNGTKPILEIMDSTTRPHGIKVAAPAQGGQLNGTAYFRGTSNASALATRAAALLVEELSGLRDFSGDQIPDEYYPVLLKTLLGHSSSWSGADQVYWKRMQAQYADERLRDEIVGRFLGYGIGDPVTVMECTEKRVTVLGFGMIESDQAQDYRFPLPPSLSAKRDGRRLIISLAWISQTTPTRQRYRNAHLWVNPTDDDKLKVTRSGPDWRAVRRGTLQHEILEGNKAAPFVDGDFISLKVNCREDAGEIVSPVRYGLAVTLEVAEDVEYEIYSEVRDRLRTRVRLQAQE